jgi:putative transposase
MVDQIQLEMSIASEHPEQLVNEQLVTPNSNRTTSHGSDQLLEQLVNTKEPTTETAKTFENSQQLVNPATSHSGQGITTESDPNLIKEHNQTSPLTLNINPSHLSPESLMIATQRMAWVAPLVAELEGLPHGERTGRLVTAAQANGLSLRQARRLLDAYQSGGQLALARKPRRDIAQSRLPESLQRLLVSLWVTNPTSSPRRIRRILELNDPKLLRYLPHAASQTPSNLSVAAIAAVRGRMEQNPAMRLALMDDQARREFARIWIGEIMAAHANQLWMADMTRCDTFVYDPYLMQPFRLRVHAVIDVYSGAVPSFIFARSEGQDSTDRMLMLALLQKQHGNWAERWPIWGKPQRLYWDNGKTYRSSKSHTTLTDLGVEIVHSRPRSSHTRGNIERFFGVLHQDFEAHLPGYGGPNTTERDHQTLAKLLVNTQRWLAGELKTDPYPERLLLEEEYKHRALLWLTMDYHKQVVKGGQTREELFLSSAPATTRPVFNYDDLHIVFSRREKRRVRGNGTVTLGSRVYGLPDASLIAYQGMDVIVIINDLLPEVQPLVALERGAHLQILGALEPMEWRSDADEARAYRKAAKKAVKTILEAAADIRLAYTDPLLRHDAVLQKLAGESAPTPAIQPITLSAPKAVLITDPNAAFAQQLADDEAQFLADGFVLDAPIDVPETGPNTVNASETHGVEQ